MQFILKKSQLGLYYWEAEGHDKLVDHVFISFQGRITHFHGSIAPDEVTEVLTATMPPGATVHYRANIGYPVKEYVTREEIMVQINIASDLHGWVFDEETYVLNSLNPSPVTLKKLWYDYSEAQRKAEEYQKWLQLSKPENKQRHESFKSQQPNAMGQVQGDEDGGGSGLVPNGDLPQGECLGGSGGVHKDKPKGSGNGRATRKVHPDRQGKGKTKAAKTKPQ